MPECGITDATCRLGDLVSSAAGDALSGIAASMVQAQTEMMQLLVTSWVPLPSLDTSGTAANTFLSGSLSWVVAAVAVASLLFAAGQLAIRRKSEPAEQAAVGMLRLIFVTTLGMPLVLLLLAGGDKFSTWIIMASTENDPEAHITALSSGVSVAFAASGLQLIVAVLGIIGMFLQIGLLLARSALLVVLVAFWPISAAASITPAGDQWYRKLCGWLAAVVLYKPVAAIIYAAAFKLMDPASSQTGLGVIEGVILILMACVALPALMRFFVPAVAAAGGGKGAGAAAAGLATGAVTIGAAAATGGASMGATAGAAGASAGGSAGAMGSVGGGAAGASLTTAGAPAATPASSPATSSSPLSGGGGTGSGQAGGGADGPAGSGGPSGSGPGGAPGDTGAAAPVPSGASPGGSDGSGGDGPSGAGGGGAGVSAGDVAQFAGAAARGAPGAVGAVTGDEETT